jgi:hypothetical protein
VVATVFVSVMFAIFVSGQCNGVLQMWLIEQDAILVGDIQDRACELVRDDFQELYQICADAFIFQLGVAHLWQNGQNGD